MKTISTTWGGSSHKDSKMVESLITLKKTCQLLIFTPSLWYSRVTCISRSALAPPSKLHCQRFQKQKAIQWSHSKTGKLSLEQIHLKDSFETDISIKTDRNCRLYTTVYCQNEFLNQFILMNLHFNTIRFIFFIKVFNEMIIIILLST